MPNRKGPSGLTGRKKLHARSLTAHALDLGYKHAPSVHYTQGPKRWEGIDRNKRAYKGQYPHYADCSAYATWALWNGLSHYHKPDVVNGEHWQGGYTGTMLDHGIVIHNPRHARRGDLVIYGAPGSNGEHVATVRRLHPITRLPYVISHGSEGGPYYLPYNYRTDIMCIRRTI